MTQALRKDAPGTAVDALMSAWETDDPWMYDPAAVAPIQIDALRERFNERRTQLKVLDQRARDQNIATIDRLADAVPLLFSHTTYKSYPESFVKKGRWDWMNQWLSTLSTGPIVDVDLSNVNSVDDWVVALHKVGHYVIASSGTTGYSSFVNLNEADRAHMKHATIKDMALSTGIRPEPVYPFFAGAPRSGRNMGAMHTKLLTEIYARPGDAHYLTDEHVSIAELDRLASIRRAIVEGTATAASIRQAEAEASQREAFMETQIQRWIGELLERRKERLLLFAGASMLWRVVEAAQGAGVPDGDFHPETVIKTGGGMKGFRGPATFREDMERFFGGRKSRIMNSYGMTELCSMLHCCEERHYHFPPTIIPLLLDKSGETLINAPSGTVEGRGGFFDIGLTGRWGGVISGDRLKISFDPCACGRKGPSVLEVARYGDLPEGDDKLTCAGTIDTYVRGLTGGDWQS